ncbi:type II toxin-antitoxin system VapC family toxin [Mycolicibacterium goodii]|uniref:Type II toxin-antitoxin system VapC family toxin n=1 Tax=Mycolicibacterium goodii TaxID=134601 RepID=A0ABS6I090_MYCGD|nr:type II toxin-antitoxin system VapC family toxin [Mycolicibacterium goodii]OKH63164.1 twitching motility protein PilT [Mycobacterium sp. SWH-M5]MBU8821107.1 type II toxin-antitoxin system VapC family toxin [Mycolicibacterium goodii]MBU8827364.1 type II toxin-antitoxin system VapC family toxin [Mycolicibacterium goodii]MBU8833248.1 type II toxin-antitoxin system VapC family toxin [Mycolicibacterium goodii]MBU8841019.1 type II toxin-antitoxin system VapC family toxin [Mycolicibacterium goodii
MNVLLDTHTLLWLVSTPSDVDASALAVLADPNTNLWVTAASAWEIAIKTRLGRLDGEALLAAWSDVIADMSTTELPIDSADAILAGRLPWVHKDPFDRVIVAQALRHNLTIATRDAKILDAAMTPTLQA